MAHAPFDPSRAVEFDLANGVIRLRDASSRALVPADALVKLCERAGPEATRAFGKATGEALGVRASRGLGGGPDATRGASLEAVVEHAGGELALAGFGSLSAERWGDALIFVVDHAPAGAAGDALVAAVLEGVVYGATWHDAECVTLARDGARVRFLLVGHAGADRYRALAASGLSWASALAALHGPATSDGDPA